VAVFFILNPHFFWSNQPWVDFFTAAKPPAPPPPLRALPDPAEAEKKRRL